MLGYIMLVLWKYTLTTLGKVLYEVQLTIEGAIQNFWKLSAIDLFKTSTGHISEEDETMLLHTLIVNDNLTQVISRSS
jgi:hypothetical protein